MNINLPCIFLSRQKVMLVTILGEKVFEDQVAETVKYKSNREDMSSLISLNVDWTKQMDLLPSYSTSFSGLHFRSM